VLVDNVKVSGERPSLPDLGSARPGAKSRRGAL